MTVEFERPGTFPRPGPTGRVVRLVAGLLLLWFFTLTLRGYDAMVSLTIPRSLLFWFGVVACFYALPRVVGISAGRDWGRRSQLIWVLLALPAAAFDFVRYGQLWGPPPGVLSFVLLAYVTGFAGLSFILAGLLAVPG